MVVIHKESREIIYYQTVGSFDPDYLDIFRSSIYYKTLDLPMDEGEIEQAVLEGKYLISRAGKLIWTILIMNQKPVLRSRESLTLFCNKFEELYYQELKGLYSEFNGDISIFLPKSLYKVSIDMLVDSEFHLHLTLPHKLGSTKGKDISTDGKKLWHLAKEIAHKNKGRFFLGTLLNKTRDSLKLESIDIVDLIYDFVQNEIFLPISLDYIKRKIELKH